MKLKDTLMEVGGGWLMARVNAPKFLDHLEAHLATVASDDTSARMKAIKGRSAELHAEHKEELVVDKASDGMLALSTAVLAAYENLLPVIGDRGRTIRFLQHVMAESLVHFGSLSTRVFFRKGGDILDVVESYCASLSKSYGQAMSFEFERGTDYFEFRVTDCFFKNFFEQAGERDVTTVLCAGDAFWMDEIDPALAGARVERSSIMSIGDDVDVFRVSRTDDPLASNADVLTIRGPGRPGQAPTG